MLQNYPQFRQNYKRYYPHLKHCNMKKRPNVTKNVTINLSNVERDVFVLISSKKGIKRSEIAQELLKTEMTIHRTIKKLIELKLIRRVGSNKTGY